MKTVPLQVFKQRLSALVEEAEAGEQIVLTRHGRPVALLTSAADQHVTVGARFGKSALKPLFRRPATQGRYLAALEADRTDRFDGR